LAQARIAKGIEAFPFSQDAVRENIDLALGDLGWPAFTLALWLDEVHWKEQITPSAESNRSRQALMAMYDTCSDPKRKLRVGFASKIKGTWGSNHASQALLEAREKHSTHFEAYAWGFQPEEDDLGQYDDMELVGEANRHEATNLNRSAAVFLGKLSSEHLPELLDFRSWPSKALIFRDELARVKAEMDKLAEGIEHVGRTDWIEAAKPGLEKYGILRAPRPGPMRRALLWVQGRKWDYPCRRRANFDGPRQGGAHSPAAESRFWDDFRLFPWLSASPDNNNHHPAGMWNCILASHRIVQEKALPLVRQAHAKITDALTQYDTAVSGAAEKLQTQVRELLAGRGWEAVEQVEIGMAHDHHWVEVSRAKPGSLTDVRNVTLWRRMIVPLGEGALARLEWGEREIESLT
jgi:hypothetical protein